MTAYTFHSLSDADFEDLVSDLLSAKTGLTFQAFAKGRDSGIDLLHGARIRGQTVVQCKHYWRSGYKKLENILKKEELAKIATLNPHRYILASSVSLTPQNKEHLLAVLSPYCKGVDDIYGCDDLNSLIRMYPRIETSHFKLWLTSASVLQRILRHGAVVWNAMTKGDIERKMSLYVPTAAYDEAIKILNEHNYCILSGIPGIGKTTLAQVLVTRLCEDGFDLIAVRDDIQEAFDLLNHDKKQVVYYDDFLGRSSIGDRLGKNEDRGIIRLLAEARRSKRLKVILTTREYILADARRLYEQLNSGQIDIGKCIIEVEDYTRAHRARIFYNHLYFSSLGAEYIDSLLRNKSYLAIIDHPSYSPRIIEWMTLDMGTLGVEATAYLGTILTVLENPKTLWEHAFDNQIGSKARALLLCLAASGADVDFEALRDFWSVFLCKELAQVPITESRRLYADTIKSLDGSFIRTTRVGNEIAVDFHNPSIRDYLLKVIASDSVVRDELMKSALHFEQVDFLMRLASDGQVKTYATGEIALASSLQSSIKRTLTALPALFQIVRLRDGSNWGRKCHDIGARLSLVTMWSVAYKSKVLVNLAADLAAELINAGQIVKVATVKVRGFIDAVLLCFPPAGGKYEPMLEAIIREVGSKVAQSTDVDDWAAWTSFIEENELFFHEDEKAQWKDRVRVFCDEEMDVILDNAETAYGASQWYVDIKDLGQSWGLKVDSTRLERRIEELAQAENDEQASRGISIGESDRKAAVSDDVIDRLFTSLSCIDK